MKDEFPEKAKEIGEKCGGLGRKWKFHHKINMFHKIIELKFKEGTELELIFQNGEIKVYNISVLFQKYPQLEVLKNRELFLNGKLMGGYGIYWNDKMDIEAETIYEDGMTIGKKDIPINQCVADAVSSARARSGISQSELSRLTGIDQSDISKIERGIGNPSVGTLKRLADAMGMELSLSISQKYRSYPSDHC